MKKSNLLADSDWGIISKYRTPLMGIATLFVLLVHGNFQNFFCYPKKLSFILPVISYGNCGVDLFLFVSGIGLFFSMKKNPNLKIFYLNRIKRFIIPVLCIILGYIFFDCILGLVSKGIVNFIFQFWYVPFTMCMYAIYPCIFFALNAKSKIIKNAFFVLSILASVVLSIVIQYFAKDVYFRFCLATDRLPVFLIGCYCGKFVYEKKRINKKFPLLNLVSFIIITCLLQLVITTDNFHYIRLRYYSYVFFTIWLSLSFSIVSENLNIKSKVISFLGKLSLEIYIFHALILLDFYVVSDFGKLHSQFWIYYLIIIPVAIVLSIGVSRLYIIIYSRNKQ